MGPQGHPVCFLEPPPVHSQGTEAAQQKGPPRWCALLSAPPASLLRIFNILKDCNSNSNHAADIGKASHQVLQHLLTTFQVVTPSSFCMRRDYRKGVEKLA